MINFSLKITEIRVYADHFVFLIENQDNSRDVVVDSLMFPTGMTFGPDGALYISNGGFGPPNGQILKLVINNTGDGDNDGDDNDHNDHHNHNDHSEHNNNNGHKHH